jgi:hypothetical protein
MMVGIDPLVQGLVTSLTRPGGNITGRALMTRELSRKRLELLKAAVPGLSYVALLVDAENPDRQAHLHTHEAAARVLGIQLLRPGRTTSGVLLPTLRRSLMALLKAPGQAYGWCRTRWSGATLAITLPSTRGIALSAETMRRWLHDFGWVTMGSLRR